MSCIGNNKWRAYTPLGFHSIGRHIGHYDTALKAARARRDYMLEHSAHAINPEETDESDADGDDDDDEASVPPLPGDDKLERSKWSNNTSGNSPPNIHILAA